VDLGSPGVLPSTSASVYEEIGQSSAAEHVYALTTVDKSSLGNVQRPSNVAAGTADDVTDITLIDNDLYDRQG